MGEQVRRKRGLTAEEKLQVFAEVQSAELTDAGAADAGAADAGESRCASGPERFGSERPRERFSGLLTGLRPPD
jgi:hypothetical protein